MPLLNDLTGKRFNRLLVIERVFIEEYPKKTFWKCICDCGTVKNIDAHFLSQSKIHSCGCYRKEKALLSNTIPYAEIKKRFEFQRCELLEPEDNYKNATKPLLYKCSCGNISKTDIYSLENGRRCMKCGSLRRSGKRHFNWNNDLSNEERITKRQFKAYYDWREKVLKRDNNKCVICGSGKRLNAHHLESWANNKELRLAISNGVALCKWCHEEFHKIYGNHDSTKSKFDQFVKIKRNNGVFPDMVHPRKRTIRDRLITYNGITKSVTEWAKEIGISRYAMYGRLDKGWPIEDVLFREEMKNIKKMLMVPRYQDIDGQLRPISELAEMHGITPRMIRKRLHLGWTIAEALTTPKIFKGYIQESQ